MKNIENSFDSRGTVVFPILPIWKSQLRTCMSMLTEPWTAAYITKANIPDDTSSTGSMMDYEAPRKHAEGHVFVAEMNNIPRCREASPIQEMDVDRGR